MHMLAIFWLLIMCLYLWYADSRYTCNGGWKPFKYSPPSKPYHERRRIRLTIGFTALATVMVMAFSGIFH